MYTTNHQQSVHQHTAGAYCASAFKVDLPCWLLCVGRQGINRFQARQQLDMSLRLSSILQQIFCLDIQKSKTTCGSCLPCPGCRFLVVSEEGSNASMPFLPFRQGPHVVQHILQGPVRQARSRCSRMGADWDFECRMLCCLHIVLISSLAEFKCHTGWLRRPRGRHRLRLRLGVQQQRLPGQPCPAGRVPIAPAALHPPRDPPPSHHHHHPPPHLRLSKNPPLR